MSIEKEVAKQVESVVQATIQTQIAKALSEDPAALVKAVVDQALSSKKNSYDRRTVFESAVDEMIQAAAKEEFKGWLADQKPLIRSAIQDRLARGGTGFIEMVADQLITGLAESFYVSVRMNVED